MKPELAQFESDNKDVGLVKLNVDDRDTEGYKPYAKYMTSRSIPFTVVIDKDGKVLADFVGYKDAGGIKEVVTSTK